jgi:acyl-CoA hydrolase
MTDWKQRYQEKQASPVAALRSIGSAQTLFIGSGAAEPQLLVTALANRASELADIECP